MTILPNNVAVCGRTHHAEWCASGLIHDPFMSAQITKHLRPGDVVIEGGAHIGTLTRGMLDAGAQVLAFEPNHDAAECLRHNCPEAVVHEMALGEEADAECALAVDAENAGMTHTLPGEGVRVTNVDRFVNYNIRLIKADIEGCEPALIRGAREVIARYKPVLILEVNRSALARNGESDIDLLQLVESLGYRWSILQPQCRVGDEQYDVECIANA